MEKNLIKIAFVAMMVIAISFSGCAEQADSGGAKSTSTQQTTTTGLAYPLVDTGQGTCYDDSGEKISCPAEGKALYG